MAAIQGNIEARVALRDLSFPTIRRGAALSTGARNR